MSQYGEHLFILEHFAGRTGRFLDIGAGSGDCKSNTVPLLEAGWTGVFVEPAINQVRWLIERYGEDPRVEIIPAALSFDNLPLDFWEGGDYSTSSMSHKAIVDKHSQGKVAWRERLVPCIMWRDLPADFNFVNIDVEGNNLEVLMGMWRECSPEMVCIEMDPANDVPTMRSRLRFSGLTNQREFGGNLLAWR